ncbi:MAG TPA: hypothetical protein VFU69_06955, partial [Ktedonobacterales bacterium]|nr:hypothetical protein [Ktedonobacterales bacterium]
MQHRLWGETPFGYMGETSIVFAKGKRADQLLFARRAAAISKGISVHAWPRQACLLRETWKRSMASRKNVERAPAFFLQAELTLGQYC